MRGPWAGNVTSDCFHRTDLSPFTAAALLLLRITRVSVYHVQSAEIIKINVMACILPNQPWLNGYKLAVSRCSYPIHDILLK